MKVRGIIEFISAAAGILLLGSVLAQDQQFPDNPPFEQTPDSQPDSVLLPGDQFDPAALPGDQFDPAALPGDQFDPAALPGDQFDPAALPGDQFDSASVPSDPLFQFIYDGTTLRNRGSAAATPELVVKPGSAAPRSEDSPFGPAVYFSGASTYAIPYEFDLVRYPAVTITAWVRQDSDANDTRAIFSRDSDGVSLSVDGGRLAMRSGRRGAQSNQRLPKDEWVFVAGVTDTAAGWLRMHQNDAKPYYLEDANTATTPQRALTHPVNVGAEKRPYVFVGASNFVNWGKAARAIAMQDIRVFTRALSENEIDAIRRRTDPSATASAAQTNMPAATSQSLERPVDGGQPQVPGPIGATSGGSLADSDTLPVSCSSNEDCSDGSYCAFERLCHPDRHAPLQPIETVTLQTPLTSLPQSPASPANSEQPQSGGGSAAVSGLPRPVGEPYITGVSGYDSKVTHTLDFEDQFLFAVHWNETSDRPCSIDIEGRIEYSESLSKILFNCGESGTSFSSSGAVILPTPDPMQSDWTTPAVTTLQVCNNTNSNRRMKGLRIGGPRIEEDGSTAGHFDDEDQLPNCKRWAAAQLCPERHAGTGIVLHVTRASGRNEQITGLQLICRRIGLE